MGTSSSICYSDSDVPEYSPAYLGQIYAGVILNSAKSNNSGYASTLSLNSLYASTLSLNSICDKRIGSRKNSLSVPSGPGVVKVLHDKRKEDVPLIDEAEEDDDDSDSAPLTPVAPLAEPESLNNDSSPEMIIKHENLKIEEKKELPYVDSQTNNIMKLIIPPVCGNSTVAD